VVKNVLMAVVMAVFMTCACGTRTLLHAEQAGQAASAAAPGTLTDASLRQMLDNMGLAPKPLSKGFLVSVKRDTWTIYVQLVLSSDQTKLGMNANCGLVENPDSVSAAQWKALLVANEDIDPSFFYFDASKKKLYLHRVLDNHGITPAFLRTQIDLFADNVRKTGDLWTFVK
jgi:hypothetical protein